MITQLTDVLIAKIVLGYLTNRRLDKTAECFMSESQVWRVNQNCENNKERILNQLEDFKLLPSLEDILSDYFAYTDNSDIQCGKIYQLWKQLDVTLSQIRSFSLGRKKTKAFLRTKKLGQYRDQPQCNNLSNVGTDNVVTSSPGMQFATNKGESSEKHLKRKSLHPKRKGFAEKVQSDDFSHLIETCGKLADNINTVVRGDVADHQQKNLSKDTLNFDEILKCTDVDADLSYLFSLVKDLGSPEDNMLLQSNCDDTSNLHDTNILCDDVRQSIDGQEFQLNVGDAYLAEEFPNTEFATLSSSAKSLDTITLQSNITSNNMAGQPTSWSNMFNGVYHSNFLDDVPIASHLSEISIPSQCPSEIKNSSKHVRNLNDVLENLSQPSTTLFNLQCKDARTDFSHSNDSYADFLVGDSTSSSIAVNEGYATLSTDPIGKMHEKEDSVSIARDALLMLATSPAKYISQYENGAAIHLSTNFVETGIPPDGKNGNRNSSQDCVNPLPSMTVINVINSSEIKQQSVMIKDLCLVEERSEAKIKRGKRQTVVPRQLHGTNSPAKVPYYFFHRESNQTFKNKIQEAAHHVTSATLLSQTGPTLVSDVPDVFFISQGTSVSYTSCGTSNANSICLTSSTCNPVMTTSVLLTERSPDENHMDKQSPPLLNSCSVNLADDIYCYETPKGPEENLLRDNRERSPVIPYNFPSQKMSNTVVFSDRNHQGKAELISHDVISNENSGNDNESSNETRLNTTQKKVSEKLKVRFMFNSKKRKTQRNCIERNDKRISNFHSRIPRKDLIDYLFVTSAPENLEQDLVYIKRNVPVVRVNCNSVDPELLEVVANSKEHFDVIIEKDSRISEKTNDCPVYSSTLRKILPKLADVIQAQNSHLSSESTVHGMKNTNSYVYQPTFLIPNLPKIQKSPFSPEKKVRKKPLKVKEKVSGFTPLRTILPKPTILNDSSNVTFVGSPMKCLTTANSGELPQVKPPERKFLLRHADIERKQFEPISVFLSTDLKSNTVKPVSSPNTNLLKNTSVGQGNNKEPECFNVEIPETKVPLPQKKQGLPNSPLRAFDTSAHEKLNMRSLVKITDIMTMCGSRSFCKSSDIRIFPSSFFTCGSTDTTSSLFTKTNAERANDVVSTKPDSSIEICKDKHPVQCNLSQLLNTTSRTLVNAIEVPQNSSLDERRKKCDASLAAQKNSPSVNLSLSNMKKQHKTPSECVNQTCKLESLQTVSKENSGDKSNQPVNEFTTENEVPLKSELSDNLVTNPAGKDMTIRQGCKSTETRKRNNVDGNMEIKKKRIKERKSGFDVLASLDLDTFLSKIAYNT